MATSLFTVDGFMASVFNIHGQVDLDQINPANQYGWCFNHEEKRAIEAVPKAAMQTYFKEDSLVLLNNKQGESLFQFWACQPLPGDATVKITVFHQTSHERNIPIKMCTNDRTLYQTDKYVQTAMTGSRYEQRYGHDVVVVPINSFVQKNKEMNVETGETGVGYTGKFILPCKTHDVIKGNKSHVVMVACLEIPHRTPWMQHTAIATVNVRVCSTPGRDLRNLYATLRRDTEPTSSVQANKGVQPAGGRGEGRERKRQAAALFEDDEKQSSSKTPAKTDIRMGTGQCENLDLMATLLGETDLPVANNGTGHCEILDLIAALLGDTDQPVADLVDGFTANVFNTRGQVDLDQINPANQYGWCFNHKEKRAIEDVPKAAMQTYFKEDSLVLLNNKQGEFLFHLWACQPLPGDATVTIAVFHQTRHERNIPIKMCANNSILLQTDKYVQTAMTGSRYEQRYGHDVVVVPLNSFVQKNKEMNVETGETGVGYTGKFILPCKTHDVIKGNRSYVVMVACLEFPHRAPWVQHTEIATVNVRVCSTPGRELRYLYDAPRKDMKPTSSVQANKDVQPDSGWRERRKGKRQAAALCEDEEKLSLSKTPAKTDSKMVALRRQGMTEDDRSALLKSHYEDALKKHAIVSIEVIRALFVGPSGAGKSSLRHLLVHGESKEMRTSTPVMETPDIVVFGEHYTMDEGSTIWKPVSESCLNQSVKRCAEEKHYQECVQYPTTIGNTTRSASAQPTADVVQDPNQRGSSQSQSTGNTLANVQTIANNVFTNTQIPRMQSDELGSLDIAHVKLLDSFASRGNAIRLDKASFLHVIDSGGQPVFQDILPLLLAIPCTYIQVFDASKDFHEPIKTTYRPQEGVELPLSSSQPLETQWEFIQHSLSSIQTMAQKFACKDLEIFKGTCPEPRIIIAGTFKDKVLASGKCEEIISNVEQRIKSLEGKPYFRHIQWPDSSGFFLVDNHMTIHSKGTGEGVDLAYLNKFRECISNKSGVLKLDVPLMWFLLELVTRRIEKKFFKEDELKHFCLKNGYVDYRKADEQFFCLLKLLHVLGFYAYFDLDPKYLRGSANYVCTDATALYREVSKLLAVQYTPAPSGTTEEFKTTGIIRHPYAGLLSELGIITDVDPVWFLEVLHHVGIAARLTPSCDPPSYFIPSCLPYGKAKVPAYSSVGPLCITFVFEQDSFTTHCDLPRSVFCRLVVELANREWKVILQESDRKSVKFSCPRPSTFVYLTEKPGHIQCQVVIDESAALSSLPDRLQEIHRHSSTIRARLEENLHHITQQVFGEKFHKIAQIRPVLPCSCQPDVRYTAPVDDSGVATCFHCGSFPKLPPSQKVWFSPPDPSEAMVRVVRETGVAFWKLEEVSTVDELSTTNNPPPVPSSTKIHPSGVDEGQEASQLNQTKTDTSDSTEGTTSPLDGASQTDLNDKCPSDVGVLGILKHIPQWYELAVSLGVPIAQVKADRTDLEMGGAMALLHWRNGRCGGGFPNTWGFLLETVEKLHGPLVAKQLRDEAEGDITWSLS